MAKASEEVVEMVTPQFLDEIIRAVEQKVALNNANMLRRIAKHVVKSFTRQGEVFMPSTIKELHQLQNMGMLSEDIEQALTRMLPSLEKEIRDAFLVSAREISNYNNQFTTELVKTLDTHGQAVEVELLNTEAVGLPKNAQALHMSVTEIRKLEQAYKATKGTVKNLCKTYPQSCNEAYVDICDRAYLKAQGGTPVNEAIHEAIEEVAERGLYTFVEYTGKRDRIEVAIARAVRSGINKANSEIVLTRCAELGVGYVKVSAHLGARVTKFDDYTNHSLWQGKVYKLDFNKPELAKFKPDKPDKELSKIKQGLSKLKQWLKLPEKYPDFVEACGYGKMLGIAGVNCRHSFSPYYPDMQVKDDTRPDLSENKKYYDKTQEQRRLERNIRALIRRIEALKGIGAKDDKTIKHIQSLEARLKQKVKEYNSYCRANKLSQANWRLETI